MNDSIKIFRDAGKLYKDDLVSLTHFIKDDLGLKQTFLFKIKEYDITLTLKRETKETPWSRNFTCDCKGFSVYQKICKHVLACEVFLALK